MKRFEYQLVNVFAASHFGGNPLAVFANADGLSPQQMQLIARQFNLSETVFVLAAETQSAVRKLKIFTPEYEMPFAGHPTIGAAFVLQQQLGLPEHYQLQTEAGLVSLHHQADTITFALNNGAQVRQSTLSKADCAEMLGLQLYDIAAEPVWVNTGTEQLLLQLTSAQAVANCRVNTALLLQKAVAANGEAQLYVWFEQQNKVKVRLFFSAHGEVREDPGTGSAAANLGGWAIHQQRTPLNWQITQGDEMNRPNQLTLRVDENQTIYVGGNAIKVGQGEFLVPKE